MNDDEFYARRIQPTNTMRVANRAFAGAMPHEDVLEPFLDIAGMPA
jgi:hypothetical protein